MPSDLVVESQATDIIDVILQLIRHPNGVHRACRHRKSRGALLSPSEVPWTTTKFDGIVGNRGPYAPAPFFPSLAPGLPGRPGPKDALGAPPGAHAPSG